MIFFFNFSSLKDLLYEEFYKQNKNNVIFTLKLYKNLF